MKPEGILQCDRSDRRERRKYLMELEEVLRCDQNEQREFRKSLMKLYEIKVLRAAGIASN
jgi:hypothetical protein